MTTQMFLEPPSKEAITDADVQLRLQKAVAAYEKACKALSFNARLKADALESLAESQRLLHGARF